MPNSTASQLLISANTIDESKLLVDLKVPWVDLKEPRHGPLGRPDLGLATAFVSQIHAQRIESHWSIAGGELSDWNAVSDEEFLRLLGSDGHIKWGLSDCSKSPAWQKKLRGLIRSLSRPTQAVLVYYADHTKVAGPTWETVLDTSQQFGLDKILIDTAIKDGSTLLDHLPAQKLTQTIQAAHGKKLKIAIAGSIPLSHLVPLSSLGADWIGVRGAVCSDPADRTSRIDPALVAEALARIPTPTPLSPALEMDVARPSQPSQMLINPR